MLKRLLIIIIIVILAFFVYRHFNHTWANKLLDKIGLDFLKIKVQSWIILTWEVDQDSWDTFTFQESTWEITNSWNQTWSNFFDEIGTWNTKLPAIETDKIPDTTGKITTTTTTTTTTTKPNTTTTKKTTTTSTNKWSSSQDSQDVRNLLNNISD